jgi:hypothetical protein
MSLTNDQDGTPDNGSFGWPEDANPKRKRSIARSHGVIRNSVIHKDADRGNTSDKTADQ